MKNIIIKNGIIGGLIVSIVMATMTLYMKENPEFQPNAAIGFLSMFFAFIFVILGVKQQRENDNGEISFTKGLKTGVSISIIISTMYVLVWLIIYYIFFPNFIEQYSEMVLKSASPEELQAKTDQMNQMKEWYKNPVMVILITYMEILPLGIVVSLIASLVFKKKL